jgi:hypothetical protein
VVGENLRSSPATAGRKRVILQPIRVIRDIRGCLFSATSALSACHAVAVAEAGGEMIGAIHLNSESFRELGSNRLLQSRFNHPYQGAAPIPPYLAKDCAILVTA